MNRWILTTIGTGLLIIGLATTSTVAAQPTSAPTPTASPSPTPQYSTGNFFKDIARDQKAIWTSPFHAKKGDLKWVVPVGLVTTGLMTTDRRTSGAVPVTGNWPTVSKDISYAGGTYVTSGLAVGMYLVGKTVKNDTLRDTGRLAAEALINTAIVTQVFKYSFGRERPFEGVGNGKFFSGGRSFFSGHASSSFAIASIVACQYDDNPYIKFGAYAAASAIALSRYTGRKHFLSDIFIGGVVGYEIGHYVCKNRQTKPAGAINPDPNKFSWKPVIEPWTDRRYGMGGQLVWHF